MNAEINQAYQEQFSKFHALLDTVAYAEAAVLLSEISEPLFQIGATQTWLNLFHQLPSKERTTRAPLLIAAGDAWRLRDNWQQASTYYHQALQVAEATANVVDQGHVLVRQAILCWLRGDVEGAVKLYEQAAVVLKVVDTENPVWNKFHNGYALALSSIGRLDEAEQLLQRQLRTFQRNADITWQWTILHNLGIMVYLRRGAWQAAEAMLREALHLAEENQHPFGEAYLSNSLAHMLNWQQCSSEALALALRAQAIGEELSVPNIIAFAFLNQAQALGQQGDCQAGEQACQRALACLKSALSSPLRCEILLTQSQLQRVQSLTVACRTAEEALVAARLQGDLWTTGLCLLQIAELSIDLNQLDTIQTIIDEAYAIFERYGDRYQLLRWHILAAQVARVHGNWHMLAQHVHTLLADLNQYPALATKINDVLARLLADTLQYNDESRNTLSNLAVAWGDAFATLATELLQHSDAQVRRWTAAVLEQHNRPWAWALLANHSDPAPSVCMTIQTALKHAMAHPPPQLELRCLGSFVVSQGSLVIADDHWTSLHAQLILTYLVLHRPTTRDELIDLLWPDEPIEKAGVRLRATLRLLRKTLSLPWHPEADYVVYDNERYKLAPTVQVTSDVQYFQRWVELARQQNGGARYNAAMQAVICYGGEFMPGWYNEWVLGRREELVADWLWAQEEYTLGLLLEGRFVDAEAQARKIISTDPFRERAWQLLLRVLCQQGRKAEAIKAYRMLNKQLFDELGIEPSPETQQLVALLRQHS
jgi:DNA-binding SARP family transcriptional activator